MDLPVGLSYLKVVPSYDCAKGCFYCYNTLLGQRSTPNPQAVESAVMDVLERSPVPLTVEIIGGEPLEPPALEFTIKLLEMLRSHPKCDRTVVSTALASPRILSRVSGLVDLLYFSIDVSEDGRNRKRISSARLQNTIRGLAGDSEVAISVVIFGDETRDIFERHIGAMRELGIKSIGFAHQSATWLSLRQIEAIVALYHLLFKLRLADRSVRLEGTILDSMELYLLDGERTAACECARNSLAIEPDARVVPGVCTDHILGPLGSDTLHENRDAALLKGDCGSCDLWNVCRGGCATEAKKFNGSPLSRAPFHCQIMKGLRDRVRDDVQRLPTLMSRTSTS